MTLRQRTYSAVRWTTAASAARALLQVLQIAVLARLLAPADYGLMAMVSVVLGFASLFADLGLNSAYVQRQEVTQQQRSSLFWLNVLASLALSLAVLGISPLLAVFFGDERLTPLLMLSASSFVLGALGQQVRMSAEKVLNFRAVVLTEIAAALLGFAAAVVLAWAGWGVYALVWGSIVTAASASLLAWIFLAAGWRPLWHLRLADVRQYLGFGGAVVANNIVNQVNLSLDLLLGGRLLGAAALGLYSMPRNLILQVQNMVNPVIGRVGFPLIAQVQDDVYRVRAIYLKTLNMTASANAPLYLGVAFFAPEVVEVLLGSQWTGSTELLRLLAVWGFVRSTGNPVGSLLLGMGRADLSLKWNVGLLFVVPPALWWGSQSGPVGLAWSLLAMSVTLSVPAWRILVWPLCQARLGEYAMAALRPAALAALAIYPGFFVAQLFEPTMVRLLIGAGLALPLYVALSYWFNREWVLAARQLTFNR